MIPSRQIGLIMSGVASLSLDIIDQDGALGLPCHLHACRSLSPGWARDAEYDPGHAARAELSLGQKYGVSSARMPSDGKGRPTTEGEPPCAKVAATPLRAGRTRALNWKGGLNVLCQAQLPKWRGSFQWQIEARIEALQAEYAKRCTEVSESDR